MRSHAFMNKTRQEVTTSGSYDAYNKRPRQPKMRGYLEKPIGNRVITSVDGGHTQINSPPLLPPASKRLGRLIMGTICSVMERPRKVSAERRSLR